MFDPMNRPENQTRHSESESVPESPDTEQDLIQTLERLGLLNTPGTIESESEQALSRLVDEALAYISGSEKAEATPYEKPEDDAAERPDEAPEVVPNLGALPGVEPADDLPREGDHHRPVPDDDESGEIDALEQPGVESLPLEEGENSEGAEEVPVVHGSVRVAGEPGGDDRSTGQERPGGGDLGGAEPVPEERGDLGDGDPGSPRRVQPGLADIDESPGGLDTRPPVGLAARAPERLSGHITERQAAWIAERLRVEDDLIACGNTGVTADEVLEWRKDPAFTERIATYLLDKRGAFRPLSSHLLPLTWQVVHGLLTSANPKDRKEGAKLSLQVQGLLVNVQETTQSEEIRRLIEGLNQVTPVEIIDVKPR